MNHTALSDRIRRLDRLYLAADAALSQWLKARTRRDKTRLQRLYRLRLTRYRTACARPYKVGG